MPGAIIAIQTFGKFLGFNPIIPVSCTEHGRWDYATPVFAESGNIMSHNLRARKASSVHRTLKEGMSYRGNQGEVWDGIHNLSVEAKVHSSTGAMRDVFEDKKEVK